MMIRPPGRGGYPLARRSLFAISAVVLLTVPPARIAGGAEIVDQTPRSVYAGEPIAIAPNSVERFNRGFAVFARIWTVADGLGPTFNAQSCAACHHIPVVGGTETAPRAFVRRAEYGTMHSFGSNGRQESAPATLRKPLSLYGAGLLEAAAESMLVQLSDPDDRNGDGISGRCIRSPSGSCGRFGWKASSDSLDAFIAKALEDELGISQEEVTRSTAEQLVEFVRILAAPRPGRITERTRSGHEIFGQIGCDMCHTEWLPVSESNSVGMKPGSSIRPFTDLLLHDMGPALADKVQTAPGVDLAEFRTPPLWGLVSSGPPYLHDGRATTITDAISMHGGEATRSVAQWRALSEGDRGALNEFLASL